jgi:Protein kinase domain
MNPEPAHDTTSPKADFDQRLEHRLAAWFEAIDLDTALTLEEFCADAPDLIEPLHTLINGEESILALVAGLRPRVEDESNHIVGGRYLLHERLGGGGAGHVYRAQDLVLNREVALKLLHTDHLASASVRSRFEREARALASLSHPNIVSIHDFGAQDDRPYLAMQLLDGERLQPGELPLTPRRAAEIALAIAQALGTAHSQGILHRDVKPANIVFDGRRPLLADFGLARVEDSAAPTREGAVAGTLLYMAPEQLQGATVSLDERADIYSLGATLYELLTGTPPFPESKATVGTGEDPVPSVAAAILVDRPPALGLDPQHRDLELIVLHCLEKDREDRYRSAEALAGDLERYLKGREISVRPRSWAEKGWRLARRHPRQAAALLVTAVVVAFLLAAMASQQRADESQKSLLAQQVETALEAGRLREARRNFDSLRAGWPEAEMTRDLADRLHKVQVREALFDLVQQRSSVGSEREIRLALANFEEQGDSRDLLGRGLRALTHLLLSENEKALTLARETKAPVGPAIQKLAQGESIVGILRQAPSASPVECLLLTILADYGQGRDYALRKRLLDVVATDPRLAARGRVEKSIIYARSGEYLAALECYGGLDKRVFGESFIRDETAYMLLHSDDVGGALALYEDVPWADLGPKGTALLANALQRVGKNEEAKSLLAGMGERGRDHAMILSAQADQDSLDGDREAAKAKLARALRAPMIPRSRYDLHIRALQVEIDAVALASASPTERRVGPEDTPLIREFLRRAQELSLLAATDRDLAICHQIQYVCHSLLGDGLAAAKQIDRALNTGVRGVAIESQWVHMATGFADFKELPNNYRYDFGSRGFLLRRAKFIADRLIREQRPLLDVSAGVAWDKVVGSRAYIALREDDEVALAKLTDIYEREAAPGAEKSRFLEKLRFGLRKIRTGEFKFRDHLIEPPPHMR